MITIAHYDDTLHRSQVIALWKDVFGYDTPHNEHVVAFYRMLGYDVEPRLRMGKRIR